MLIPSYLLILSDSSLFLYSCTWGFNWILLRSRMSYWSSGWNWFLCVSRFRKISNLYVVITLIIIVGKIIIIILFWLPVQDVSNEGGVGGGWCSKPIRIDWSISKWQWVSSFRLWKRNQPYQTQNFHPCWCPKIPSWGRRLQIHSWGISPSPHHYRMGNPMGNNKRPGGVHLWHLPQ